MRIVSLFGSGKEEGFADRRSMTAQAIGLGSHRGGSCHLLALNELQLPEDGLDRVVRESFVFLLERENPLNDNNTTPRS
jgi:hypothetical protein